MKTVIEFLSGKKTYIVGAAIFIAGGLTALGVDVPAWVWEMLAGCGAMAGRAAVNKIPGVKK